MAAVLPLTPPSIVLRRSQFVNVVLEHTAGGMLPARLRFEVRARVDSDDGKEEGAAVKALFWRYLQGQSATRGLLTGRWSAQGLQRGEGYE